MTKVNNSKKEELKAKLKELVNVLERIKSKVGEDENLNNAIKKVKEYLNKRK